MKHLKKFNESSSSKLLEKIKETNNFLEKLGHYKDDNDGWVIGEGIRVPKSAIHNGSLVVKFSEVRGHFYCSGNQLTSLEGSPKEVGGFFSCDHNQLTSLEGAPKEVGGDFYCHSNQLTSLEGAPKEVGRDFMCSNNLLTSLEGAPDRVGGHFHCRNNKIMNIDGLLWKSFKRINLENNPVDGIVGKWINSENREELIEYFIDLNVIQGDKLIMERLKAFHEEMGLEMEIDFKKVEKYYKIIE